MATRRVHDHQAALMVRHGLDRHTALHAAVLMHHVPGLFITSGRRTVARNMAVGGARRSWHLKGRAVDFAGPLTVLQRAREVAYTSRVSPGCTGPEEVLLEGPGTRRQHLHVAW
jgi:uncharacterized protein YcbK (DUF882 family)